MKQQIEFLLIPVFAGCCLLVMRQEHDQKCLGIYRLWCSCDAIADDFHTTIYVLYLII